MTDAATADRIIASINAIADPAARLVAQQKFTDFALAEIDQGIAKLVALREQTVRQHDEAAALLAERGYVTPDRKPN